MTRKMLTAAIAVTALLLSVLSVGSLTADAHDNEFARAHSRTCVYNNITGTSHCAKQEAYPGPFTNMPASPTGPYGWGALNIAAGAGAAAGGGATGGTGGGGGLAHTGSESTVLGYVGTGLIAFGAVALGSRRKFFQGALD